MAAATALQVSRPLALAFAAACGGAALAQPALPADTAGGALAATAAVPAWQLDPTHTFVHWEVLHTGTSTIRGRFDRTRGNVQFDAAAQALDVSITIDAASVNSGVPVLDTLLRGSAMLDATAHPQAYFTARQARFDGAALREVRGEFTLRGTSQPLTLRALRWNCGLNPVFRRTVCGGDFEAFVDRSAFGITHSLPFVTDRVRLLIQVEAIAP